METDKTKNKRVANFTRWVIKRRWFVLIGCIGVAMMSGMGGEKLKFNNDYHIFFDEGNPQVEAFDALQEKYTKDDNAFIVVQPKKGGVFTKETMIAIQELEQMAWQTPFSTRVDALTNYQHTRAEGDDMYVENLVPEPKKLTEGKLKSIEEIALNEPLLVDRLVNSKGELTAINITVTLPADSMEAPMVVGNSVRKMVKDWQEKYPDYEVYLSGIIMMNVAFAEASMGDFMTLVPIMFAVILFMVFFTTLTIGGIGSALGSFFTALFVLLFSIMTAMGLAGWAGVELTGPSSSAPIMIMTLAIADSIHLLVTMIQNMRQGMDRRTAIVESMRINFLPVFLTSITTVIGFLTLNFAEGAPFHDLGNITAVGVTAAFFFSILFLPAFMSILPISVSEKTEKAKKSGFIDGLANLVIRRKTAVLVASGLVVIGVTSMAFQNELNNEFVKFFDKSVKFRADTDYISENLTGIYNVEYSLSSGNEDGISDPAYLKKLDEFEQWCRSQDEVTHVNTFSEVMKRVNKSMHGDDKSYYKVPDGKQQAAQFLLLYEMSLPYGLDLNNQINVDKSETRYTITTKNISSNQMIAFTERAEKWLKDNAPEAMFSYGMSPAIMFSHITRTNMNSMLESGLGALIVISFILIFALRSFKYGLISIVPNMTPIGVAFGVWYFTNGQINMALAVVLGMTLGIVVDDTIHLLSKYIRARRELGKTPEDAVRYAFTTVGRAVIVTTIVLIAGFSVLMQSNFGFNSDMGALTAMTIGIALVLDLFLLPALLLAIDKDKKPSAPAEPVPVPETEPELV